MKLFAAHPVHGEGEVNNVVSVNNDGAHASSLHNHSFSNVWQPCPMPRPQTM